MMPTHGADQHRAEQRGEHADQDRGAGAVDRAGVDVVALDVPAEPGVGVGRLAGLGQDRRRYGSVLVNSCGNAAIRTKNSDQRRRDPEHRPVAELLPGVGSRATGPSRPSPGHSAALWPPVASVVTGTTDVVSRPSRGWFSHEQILGSSRPYRRSTSRLTNR